MWTVGGLTHTPAVLGRTYVHTNRSLADPSCKRSPLRSQVRAWGHQVIPSAPSSFPLAWLVVPLSSNLRQMTDDTDKIVRQIEEQCISVLHHLDKTSTLLDVLASKSRNVVSVRHELSSTISQMLRTTKTFQEASKKKVSQEIPEGPPKSDAVPEKFSPRRKRFKAGKWRLHGSSTGSAWIIVK